MPPMDFSEMFPHAERSGIELLQKMLTFNPDKRITVREALESSFLSAVRRPSCEKLTTETMVFPFEYSIHGGPDNEKLILRRLIYNEALLFHQEPQEVTSPILGRHRSATMGAIPQSALRPFSPKQSKVDSASSDDDKKNCCIL